MVRMILKPQRKVGLIIVSILVAIAFYSIVDRYVIAGYYGRGDESNIVESYWTWMNVIILMFSVVAAVAFWAGAPMSKQTTQIIYGILVSGFILLISGFEDVMYFLNHGNLPAADVQWTWMAQYRMWGFWNTRCHLLWMSFWLFMVLPFVWIVIYQTTRKYRVSVAIRKIS
jgi:hypothetical protein